eukprot:1158446-Pelagomonas_calceolata.AAC.10
MQSIDMWPQKFLLAARGNGQAMTDWGNLHGAHSAMHACMHVISSLQEGVVDAPGTASLNHLHKRKNWIHQFCSVPCYASLIYQKLLIPTKCSALPAVPRLYMPAAAQSIVQLNASTYPMQ